MKTETEMLAFLCFQLCHAEDLLWLYTEERWSEPAGTTKRRILDAEIWRKEIRCQ